MATDQVAVQFSPHKSVCVRVKSQSSKPTHFPPQIIQIILTIALLSRRIYLEKTHDQLQQWSSGTPCTP